MQTDFVTSPLFLAAICLAVLGAIAVIAGGAALVRKRPLRFALRTLAGVLLIASGALAGAIAIGIQGYRSLNYEEIAARITVQPVGAQRFSATVRFPDGREAMFTLAGDDIYVDAQVLKWKAMANV